VVPISTENFDSVPREGSRLSGQTAAQSRPQDQIAKGEKLVAPYAPSEGGRGWATGIQAADSTGPTAILVRHDQSFRRFDGTQGYYIAALAWNTNSTMLAVLEDTYETKVRGLRDLVSPHPVPYSDVLLTAYQVSGEVVCRSLLLRDARYAQAKIIWK